MNKSRGDLDSLKLAITFSTFDGDAKHFSRFLDELARLAFPFYVNFDHCSPATKRLFMSHPNYAGGYENDDKQSFFDESHRQFALNLVQKSGAFDWVLQMDVDETLERDAPRLIREAMRLNADVIGCPVLDLWGDGKHYRVDGSFQSSHREKMFNLRTAEKLYYYHPTSHAPRHVPRIGKDPVVVRGYPLRVIHWGILDMTDVKEHTERWTTIYTRAVGGVPYKFYEYLNDPATVVEVKKVPEGIL